MSDLADPPKRPQKVGYKSPPVEHRFKKGQPSANPKGRPPKPKAFHELLRAALNRKVTITSGGRRRRMVVNDVIIQQLINKGMQADRHAVAEIVKLNLIIDPPRADPTIPEEEIRQRQELAAKLVDLLDQQAAEKKRAAPRARPLGWKADDEPDAT